MRFTLTAAGKTLFAAAMLVVSAQGQAQDLPMMTDVTPSAAAADVKVPLYDVASVKPNKGDGRMLSIRNTPDGFSAMNLSLKFLISNAYGIKQDLITGGPDWVGTARFDVDAKVAGVDVETLKKLNPEQRRTMLQPLLAERFGLKVHSETRVLPIYEMTIAKSGVKFKESEAVAPSEDGGKSAPGPGGPAGTITPGGAPPLPPGMPRGAASMSMGPGMFTGKNLTMVALANQLSSSIHRTVVDKTGLKGKYDFELKWTPDDRPPQGDAGTDTGPSIFTAVQEQLGLKLESARGPVETLVIDHAEKPAED